MKKRKKKVEKREVDRIHRWKPGHDPQDPDAVPGSPWTYLKLSGDYPADTRDKRNALKLGGGPESGIPCMYDGEMTHIVDEISALDVLEQAVVLNGEEARIEFTPEQKERFRSARLSILMCPHGHVTQFRADIIKATRERWLAKQQS
jgi:hypothetical protein